VRCAAGCCIKSVKSVFRARAPRGRDARGALIDSKSYRRKRSVCSKASKMHYRRPAWVYSARGHNVDGTGRGPERAARGIGQRQELSSKDGR
jgi:hypothetical protein